MILYRKVSFGIKYKLLNNHPVVKIYNLKKILTLIIFIFSFSILSYYPQYLLSKEYNSILNNNIKKPKYFLGTGDKLLIKILQNSQFDAQVTVLPDGSINLPRIGRVYIEGLSIYEIQKKLTGLYKEILKRPIVYVDLLMARPIKVSITGQVQRPGVYSLSINNINSLSNSDGGERTNIQSKGWPSIIDAIQIAGGIKSDGDLKSVLLIRRGENPDKNLTYKLDYWTPLKTGINLINPQIFDGDSIRILKAKTIDLEESTLIADSNFSPSFITVNVIGEVTQPGLKQIKANSPLVKSILSAGGFTNRANKSKVKLIRLNNNGTITSKIYSVEDFKNIKETNLPNLKDGDTIYTYRNLFAKGTDTLNTIAKPITPIMNSIGLIKILSD